MEKLEKYSPGEIPTSTKFNKTVDAVNKHGDELSELSLKVGELEELDESVASDNLVDAINKAAQQGGSAVPLSVVDGALCVTFNE